MKILLTGGAGQLGHALHQQLPGGIELIATSRSGGDALLPLDLTDAASCRAAVLEHRPDWVLNAGAYTALNKAESEPELALAVNGGAPRAFAEGLLETPHHAAAAPRAQQIGVVEDQVGCPTAAACWRVITANVREPVLHWSDAGAASWFDVAVAVGELAQELGLLLQPVPVNPLTTVEYPLPAERPSYSLLDCSSTRLAPQGDLHPLDLGEVAEADLAGLVGQREHHLRRRAMEGLPVLHPPLQGAFERTPVLIWLLLLQVLQQRCGR